MRHWTTWIPVLTLLVLGAGFIAKRAFAPPPAELVIQAVPSAKLAALELPERGHALSGQVVDRAGAAVSDALVFLRAGDAPHFTYTDAEGRFHLAALEDGPWHATVLARGFAPFAQDLLDSAASQTIRLEAPVGPVPGFPPLVRKDLAGVLSSRRALVLEGCEIVLTPTLAPETLDAPLPRRATAGADGHFQMPDLIVGEYTVEVLPAWARGGSWPDLARPIDGGKPLVFAHAAGDSPTVLAVELQTGEATGRLLDLDGHPLEGALILASPASDASRVWPPESTLGDGTFAVHGLPSGKYLLSVRAGSAAVQRDVLILAGESTNLEFEPLEVHRSQ